MCGKIADILATEKALSVNFILSLIKNTKTKISTLRTEQNHTHHGSQFKLKISSVNVQMRKTCVIPFLCFSMGHMALT